MLAMTLCVSAGLMIGFTAGAAQPNMEKALESLRGARRSLVEATPDKGGHRAKAIKLVDEAITEVQAGMALH